jgi:hypothetical protein
MMKALVNKLVFLAAAAAFALMSPASLARAQFGPNPFGGFRSLPGPSWNPPIHRPLLPPNPGPIIDRPFRWPPSGPIIDRPVLPPNPGPIIDRPFRWPPSGPIIDRPVLPPSTGPIIDRPLHRPPGGALLDKPLLPPPAQKPALPAPPERPLLPGPTAAPPLLPPPTGDRTPARGVPGSEVVFKDRRGNTLIRTYGTDGRATWDVEVHGKHGIHVHPWDWTAKPPRQPHITLESAGGQ